MRPINVVYYGMVSYPTGWGSAARAYIHAFHEAGINVAVVNLDFEQEAADPLVSSLLNRSLTPDFHFVNWPPIAAIPLQVYFDKVIVSTVWEAEDLPVKWISIQRRVREVWVPSTHNVSTFERQMQRPVFRLPHALGSKFYESVEADCSGLPVLKDSEFVFYSIFVWQERKWPEGIIEAYLRSFSESDNVVLVLKYMRRLDPAAPQELRPEAVLQNLRQRVGSGARVELIEGMWSESQVEALEQRGNCYVSLHRGEGWGYPLFDAACRGTPVIATAYGGPMDYLTEADHLLVHCKQCSIKGLDAAAGYEQSMTWVEPDLGHAVKRMREAVVNHGVLCKRAQSAAQIIRARYSRETIGRAAKERFSQLMA